MNGHGEVDCLYCGHLIPVGEGPRILVVEITTRHPFGTPKGERGAMHRACWERVALDLAGLQGARRRAVAG